MADGERTIEYGLTIDDKDASSFVVVDFEVHESVSHLSHVWVRAGLGKEMDPAKLVGRPATFQITFGDAGTDAEPPRFFHGLVTRVGFVAGPAGSVAIDVLIEPTLAALRLGRDNRIFPDDDVQGVVKKVLEKAKPKDLKITWSLKKPPPKQLHVFQRLESDWSFIARLLARDGINFVLVDQESGQELVLFDDSAELPDIAGEATLLDRALSPKGMDVVFDLSEQATLRPGAVMMRAYDPLNPGGDLDAKAPKGGGAGGAHELYLHPGDYDDVTVGKRLAQSHLEAATLGGRAISGRSNCPRLAPGRHLTIAGHPRDALNGRVLLRQVVHHGNVSEDEGGRRVSYENHFLAAPEKTPLRPAPIATTPRGCSVAFVTVPNGEEIHLDEVGRIKVGFPWDRSGREDDRSSGWLRVGQLPLTGSMVLPRGGFEVLIDHELGEPDRPAIVGHLYNGTSPPPYALPAEATVSSVQTATTSSGPGANELRFEDAAGKEEIFINASKDFTVSVDNDASFCANKNETTKVGSNFEQSVGTDLTAHVTSNRKLTVGASQSVNVGGDFNETVGANDSITVGGVRKVQTGGDHAEATTGQLSRTVAALQSVTGLKGVAHTVVGSSKITAGAAWLETVGRNRGSEVKGSRKETVGALKLIKAKNVSVSVTNNLTVNAAAEIMKCGGTRMDSSGGILALNAGGGLSAKAKTITIEGKRSVVVLLGACMIRLSKSGKISVKAAKVRLKGAKALGQLKHESG